MGPETSNLPKPGTAVVKAVVKCIRKKSSPFWPTQKRGGTFRSRMCGYEGIFTTEGYGGIVFTTEGWEGVFTTELL